MIFNLDIEGQRYHVKESCIIVFVVYNDFCIFVFLNILSIALLIFIIALLSFANVNPFILMQISFLMVPWNWRSLGYYYIHRYCAWIAFEGWSLRFAILLHDIYIVNFVQNCFPKSTMWMNPFLTTAIIWDYEDS